MASSRSTSFFKPRRAASIVGVSLLLLSFQNCSSGFQDQAESFSTPSVLQPQASAKSTILVGGTGFIKSYSLDHTTDALTESQTIPFPGQSPGWFDYDSATSTLFTADSVGGKLNILGYDSSTENLTLKKTVTFLNQVVHLDILKDGTDYLAYASGYNQGKYSKYRISSDLNNISLDSSFQYTAVAHTHSSAIDTDRNLAFVANKDENRIVIYGNASGMMQEMKSFIVSNPRMVVYNKFYDRLFVTTEANSGFSFVKIYSIVQVALDYDLKEEDSFSMGLRGSDIKIDSIHGYAVATVREAGKEGIWALPLTISGLLDSGRSPVFIPVPKVEARSLQISADGRYFIVTCNSAGNLEDLLIYKVSYDSTNTISNTTLIHSVNAGPGYFYSNFIIPRQP